MSRQGSEDNINSDSPQTTSTSTSRRTSWRSWSVSTAQSSNTIQGPGALTGKALMAFGEALLRGAEDIVIRRRLTVISSHFPHEDTTAVNNIDQMYADILELARPNLRYRERFRRQALKLLLMQIGSRNAYYLVQNFPKRLPFIEMRLLLGELLACMPQEWYDIKRDNAQSDLRSVYLDSQSMGELHAAAPFIDFVRQLGQGRSSAAQAAVEAGFLDMLLQLCICDFSYPFRPDDSTGDLHMSKAVLLATCTSTLDTLFVSGGGATTPNHPITVFWPYSASTPFTTKVPLEERRLAWRNFGEYLVQQRISVIDATLNGTAYRGGTLFDVCFDLLEFSRHDSYGTKIEEWALSYLLRCIALGGILWKHLTEALAKTPSDDSVDVLSRVINSLMPFITHKSSTFSLQIYMQSFSHSTVKGADPINNFIEFSVVAAAHSLPMRIALLDAGIVALLLPILEDQLKDPSEFPGAFPGDDTSSLMSAQSHSDTLRLLKLIRAQGIGAVLKEDTPTRDAQDGRRRLCCRAFEALLCSADGEDEVFMEFQALLRSTLGWTSYSSGSSSLTRATMDI